MRLRFDKTLPDFTVANDIFFEKEKNRYFCAKFYKENDLYKVKYFPRYLNYKYSKALCSDLPLQEEEIVSKEIFQGFKHYLTSNATPPIYLQYPHFSTTDNVFYQLPCLNKKYKDNFFFEPIYKNNITIDDFEKICLYLEINGRDFARILNCSLQTVAQRHYKNSTNKIIIEKIEDFLRSFEVFNHKYYDNLKYVSSSKKKKILENMKLFFSQKYLLWDDFDV